MFGFLNLVLWVGNLWFVFKETGWAAPFLRAPPEFEKQPARDAYDEAGCGQGPGRYGAPGLLRAPGAAISQATGSRPAAAVAMGLKGDYGQQGYTALRVHPHPSPIRCSLVSDRWVR